MSNQNQSLSLGHRSESQIADQSRNNTPQAPTPVLLLRPHSAEPVFPQRPQAAEPVLPQRPQRSRRMPDWYGDWVQPITAHIETFSQGEIYYV
ncbi:hypothetical protein DPMN_085723 [Dreissena polymorpha]|uniref:Uncharacterized protein n=1 Tax=Dreissena polymorpha TaxID=45954 RepID=A0A9D3YGL1_DREPO|nr:hypothetical protein DPMN_085723 [Dreissena polymorpha]